MTTMTEGHRRVTGGVDTHCDLHVVAALDERCVEVGVEEFPTTPAGYRQALRWLCHFGEVERVVANWTRRATSASLSFKQPPGCIVVRLASRSGNDVDLLDPHRMSALGH